MQRATFVAGLVVGGGVALGAVIAMPDLLPRGKQPVARTEREARPVIVTVPERRDVVPALVSEKAPAPVVEEHEPSEVDLEKEAEALAVMLQAAKMRSNETAAIATLRNIISAQAQFQAVARADENNNGVGEYASFGELSGGCGVREGAVLNPPVLSSSFRKVEASRVKRNGYYYRIFLANSAGDGMKEQPKGGFRMHEVDPNLAETTWCAYAWPVARGVTGERCFFVSQWGDLFANSDRKYGGEEEPPAYAAFDPGSRGILGRAPDDGVGGDRGVWTQAG